MLHLHLRNVPAKLDANYSGLCKVGETRGSLLTLRELDTQRVFTANHDAVRRSTVTCPAVPPTHGACAVPIAPVARAAPQLPPQQAALPILPARSTVHRQSASRVAQLNPAQSAPRSHARAIRDIRDVAFSAVRLTCCIATAAAPKIYGTAQEAPQHSCACRSAVGAYCAEHTSAPPTAAN